VRAAARPDGTTLVELLVTISILGIMAAVTTMAARRIGASVADDPARVLAEPLRVTVEQGRARTIGLVIDGRTAAATLNADGSIVADSLVRVERLSGRVSR